MEIGQLIIMARNEPMVVLFIFKEGEADSLSPRP
jgi:hypothetical protein